MQNFQKEFIEFAIHREVLRFGEFKLKSGRLSPYFFNSGLFNDGTSLKKLGEFYAQRLALSKLGYDMIFGPAYKGIPLASSLAIALDQLENKTVPYCFNRKEAKDHGEGGTLLGANLQGKVLIIDDVITAGTSIRESVNIIRSAGANPAGVIIALDRQERGESGRSAVEEIENRFGMPVISIVSLDTLIEFLEKSADLSPFLDKISRYRNEYGIKS